MQVCRCWLASSVLVLMMILLLCWFFSLFLCVSSVVSPRALIEKMPSKCFLMFNVQFVQFSNSIHQIFFFFSVPLIHKNFTFKVIISHEYKRGDSITISCGARARNYCIDPIQIFAQTNESNNFRFQCNFRIDKVF